MRNRVLLGLSHTADSEKTANEIRDDCKNVRGTCPNFYNGNSYNQAKEDAFVQSKLVEYDTYFLIDRWNLFKKIPVLGLPIDVDFTLNDSQLKDIPTGWSTDRFDKATKRIATYAVDVEWTEEEHLVGSSFGQNLCK